MKLNFFLLNFKTNFKFTGWRQGARKPVEISSSFFV